MTKLALLFLIAATAAPVAFGKAVVSSTKDDDLKPIALEDVIPFNKFSFRGFNGVWISETEFSFRDSDGNLDKYNAATEEQSRLIDAEVLGQWNASSITLNAGATRALLRYAVRQVFRHSIVAKYTIYELESGNSVNIANGSDLQICQWSPNGLGVAYVLDNNIYYYDAIRDTNTQLSNDGVPGVIYNGIPDWVYEEEVFGSGSAIWFAPNGDSIAFAKFNDTLVEEFRYPVYGEAGNIDTQYPEEIVIKYPKAGRRNPDVSLIVVNLNNPLILRVIKSPIDRVTEDHILGSVAWIDRDTVLPTWLNRRQNVSSLQACDAITTECSELYYHAEPNGWIDVDIPRCTEDGSTCFLQVYEDGWRRVIGLDVATKQKRAFTPAHTVMAFNGYDVRGDRLFYTGTGLNPPNGPAQRQLYIATPNRAIICVSCTQKSAEGEDCTYGGASFSKGLQYFSLTCTGPGPSYTILYRNDQTPTAILTWEDNTEKKELLKEYQKTQFKYIRVPVGENGEFEAIVKLHLPPYLDEENPEKKYPMIVNVYGGPNSVRVTESYSIGYPDYLATSREIVHAQIDGRGSGNKGTDMLFTINNQMGTVEIEDQIAVAKYLVENFDFIDESRVGIWGWSYGGYATAMTLLKDTERVFRCGISVAPVSNWIYYDSIYTERYMGLPTEEDNLANYIAGDISEHVENMKDSEFFLVHGNADDNVHYQQTMVFSRALQKADILFEQMSYPDEAHALSGVSTHLYHTMDDFWARCLDLDDK